MQEIHLTVRQFNGVPEITVMKGDVSITLEKKDLKELLEECLGAAADLEIRVDQDEDEWYELGLKLCTPID